MKSSLKKKLVISALCSGAALLFTSLPALADTAAQPSPAPATAVQPGPPPPPGSGAVPSVNRPQQNLTPPPAPMEQSLPTPSEAALNAAGIRSNFPAVVKVSGIAAKVGSVNITNEELVKRFLRNGGGPLLGQLITSSMIDQEAKKEKVSTSPAEVKERLKKIKTQILARSQGLTWAQYLTEAGVSEDLAKEQVRLDIELEKLVQKTLPPVNMSDQYHLRHIVILTNKQNFPNAHTDADALKLIDQIDQDIKDKKITFEEAAKKYSEDTSNSFNGGDLGWVDRNMNGLDKDFAATAFSLKNPGDLSAPVKSRFGYHLIYLVKTGVDATPAEKAVIDNMHSQVSRQDLSDYLGKLKQKYHVSNVLLPGVAMPAPNNITSEPTIMRGNPNQFKPMTKLKK